MLAVDSTGAAIGLLFAGLLLLGLWPPCWNLVERKGRIPAHTFIDYGLTYMLMGAITSFTLGQLGPQRGDTPNFASQLPNMDARLAAIAFLGGALVVCGDVFLQYAVAFLGLAIGPPLFSAMTIICGSTATYYIDGKRNSPLLLFPGVAAAVAAIALGTAAHLTKGASSSEQQEQEQQPSRAPTPHRPAIVPAGAAVDASQALPLPLAPDAFALQIDNDVQDDNSSSYRHMANGGGGGANGALHGDAHGGERQLELVEQGQHVPDDTAGLRDSSHSGKSRDGSGRFGKQAYGTSSNVLLSGDEPDSAASAAEAEAAAAASVEEGGLRQRRPRRNVGGVTPEPVPMRSVQMADRSLHMGLLIVLPGAVLNTLSYLAFQVAVNDKFGLLPQGEPLPSVYLVNFVFSAGFGVSSVAINSFFLARPPMGTARSSFMGWLRDNPWRGWSILSGVLAASGDTLQFLGGDAAGYAAAMLVSAFPLVSVALGILHFNEFSHASKAARTLVFAEVAFYLSAVSLLAASASGKSS